LRAKIDYGFTEAKTAQGHIGIKIWINNGDFLDAESDNTPVAGQKAKLPRRRRPGGGGPGGGGGAQ
jgi:small subunit ribosomal protein S3